MADADRLSAGPRVARALVLGTACAVSGLVGCGRTAPPAKAPSDTASQAEAVDERAGVASALEVLQHGSDLRACRSAVKQLNGLFARQPQDRPTGLDEQTLNGIATTFGLNADEVKEVAAGDFTLLDAHHLQACLLLRDAARGLEVDDLPPLAKATAAFAWVTRQAPLAEKAEEVLPPLYALDRARATPLEQAAIFWALLRQLGVDSCAVYLPSSPGGTGARFWAAGAVVGNDVYLFDTRLGLPLSGPGGSGVATLGSARSDKEVLAALTLDERHRYDVSAADAARAEVRPCCPLSALTARMRYLQDRLPTAQKAELASDAGALVAHLRAAAAASGVSFVPWPPGDAESPVTALRRFLAPEEGGSDRQRRQARFENELVPWGNLPAQVRALPADVEPGRTLRSAFGGRFLSLMMGPDQAHDLLLRGRLGEATSQLVSARDQLIQQRQMYHDEAAELPGEFARWAVDAEQAYADVARALRNPADVAATDAARRRLGEVWKQGDRSVGLLMAGGAADPLLNLTTGLLAVTKQEQAERAQTALERHGGPQADVSAEVAAEMWRAAADWWETYLNENPGAPKAPAARLLKARALEALGQRDAAVATLEDVSGQITPLERLARLIRVRQIKQGTR